MLSRQQLAEIALESPAFRNMIGHFSVNADAPVEHPIARNQRL